MSATHLSFNRFTNAAASATPVHVGPNGILLGGQRFNDRRLRKWRGQMVKYFEDPTGPFPSLVCFTPDGRYICNAWPRRKYHDIYSVFGRAMDFDAAALAKLQLFKPWHGKPWHVHLAAVQMDVMKEGPGGPYEALLTWNGGTR